MTRELIREGQAPSWAGMPHFVVGSIQPTLLCQRTGGQGHELQLCPVLGVSPPVPWSQLGVVAASLAHHRHLAHMACPEGECLAGAGPGGYFSSAPGAGEVWVVR